MSHKHLTVDESPSSPPKALWRRTGVSLVVFQHVDLLGKLAMTLLALIFLNSLV